jgi:hypothetical protein
MEKSPQRGLQIHFMDGSSLKVSFPTQSEDQYRRKLMIEEILKRRMLMVEADGGVHFIPLENIKYMSVYPASEQADIGVIKGAHFSE